jgi:hypothetical protein
VNPWLIFAAVDVSAGAVLAWWWIRAEHRIDERYDAERLARQVAARTRVAPDACPLDGIEADRWRLLTTQLNDLEP